jgi:hypothetical protein
MNERVRGTRFMVRGAWCLMMIVNAEPDDVNHIPHDSHLKLSFYNHLPVCYVFLRIDIKLYFWQILAYKGI